MSDTVYVDGSTLITADTMNDLNRLHYTILSDPADIAAVKASLHAAPGAIGGTTPAAGSFTTVAASSSILSSSPTEGVGYATGAGGSVTQITSISTGVTLNKISGRIITVSHSFTAGTKQTFSFVNSTIAATDTLIISATNNFDFLFGVTAVGAGSCTVNLYPLSTATQSITLNFAVIKSINA